LACRRAIASANMRSSISMDKVRTAAQAIADREGYHVHVGCGGEVTGVHPDLSCRGCDGLVMWSEVVAPQRELSRIEPRP
jgi:hypothetical protein